jgi:hypothetical protein
MIKSLPHISAMAPYALAKLTAPDGKPLISLSQNESLRPRPKPAGCPRSHGLPWAGAAYYPDPDWHRSAGCPCRPSRIASRHASCVGQRVAGSDRIDLRGSIPGRVAPCLPRSMPIRSFAQRP